MEKIGTYFAALPAWTARSHLPGGDFPIDGFYDQLAQTIGRWPFLSEPHARRLTRAYGTRVERVLGSAQSMQDLGPRFTGDLTGAELRYLIAEEWAETADDVLWRRTKLGLKATAEERLAITRFMVEAGASRQVGAPQAQG
jgi:glycerol-3-phosphate dehydrogenase